MSADRETQPPRSYGRARAVIACLVSSGSASVIVAGLIGQLIRDRSATFAILMYLPVLPVSLLAAAFDVAYRGRALPWVRFGLSSLATVGIALSAAPMIGSGVLESARSGEREVSVLHWNVQWGGGLFRSPQTWAAQRAEILTHQADLIILSEAPASAWVDQLVGDLGAGASRAPIESERGSRHWFGVVVCSRWSVRLEEVVSLPNGKGMNVVAHVNGRHLRILVVDGKSNPFISRLPFLEGIVATCRTARDAGRPFDVVVGDFNTPSRSLGFDRLVEEGFTLASRSTAGWRATFPSWLPIYDIDHVWLGRSLRVGSASFFNGPNSDHRGQVAHLLVPPEVTTLSDPLDHRARFRPRSAVAAPDAVPEAGRR
jgi:endonuclease/exonuclease/phosphatase family metal-dependent hydrolase